MASVADLEIDSVSRSNILAISLIKVITVPAQLKIMVHKTINNLMVNKTLNNLMVHKTLNNLHTLITSTVITSRCHKRNSITDTCLNQLNQATDLKLKVAIKEDGE